MAVSEKIVNTVHALQSCAAAGELTHQEFQIGMSNLLDVAAEVRELERSVVPYNARIDPMQIRLAGGNVILFKAPKAAS